MDCFENKKEPGKTSRRSKKVKNLEQEVELILSQEESDDDVFAEKGNICILQNTPSKNDKLQVISTPRASQAVLQDMLQTPRRSCRKSIKPTQDYDDIINKSCLRSNRSMKNVLMTTEEEDHENLETAEDSTLAQHKWTPAKVGRVSQKRSRKSRRNTKAHQKSKKEKQENEISPEMDEVIDETDNLVNVTKNDDNIAIVEQMKNMEVENKEEISIKTVTINKHVNSPGSYSESFNEFMEIEKQINNMKGHDMSLQLIQENSEDVKEMLSQQTNDAVINLIEIDSDDIKELPRKETSSLKLENNCEPHEAENTNKKITNENIEDSFGCYLKSNEINIADLGLNPIKDDFEDEKQNDEEEMPSLIICDEEEVEQEVVKKNENKLNETFEADDSVLIIEETTKLPPQDVMESLKMSDNDESNTPKKAPRIMLTTIDLQNQTLLDTPNIASNLKQPVDLPLPSTPKQSTKAYRFPTPYKNRQNFKFNKTEDSIQNDPSKNIRNCSWISSFTSLEPKDIVLRGIRKRSLSVCLDGNKRQKKFGITGAKHGQDRVVNFFSPANRTTLIDDLDKYIAKSLKKSKNIDAKDSANKFVTTRRKRSLSVDDSLMSSSMLVSRLPRPVPTQNTPSKSQTTTSKPFTRSKLPNFAAIHNKNFQKMENIFDHVNRKQERSKILINSNTKIRPPSAQKNISLIKVGNNNCNEKPKALKKIDLGFSSTKMLNTTNTELTKSQENINKIQNLPKPQSGITKVIRNGVIPQRIPHNYPKQKAPRDHQEQQIRSYLKPTQATSSSSTIVKQKANFNLSTSIIKPTATLSYMDKLNKTNTTTSNDDKMAGRLQRHMDLFKGRAPAARSAGVASRKNDAVIRGVRSNRRFELQMQHRKNMEN